MKTLRVVALGAEGFKPLCELESRLAPGGNVAIEPRFVQLEGENALSVVKSGAPNRLVTLPEPSAVPAEWKRRFYAVKFWGRRHLGSRALNGFDLAKVFDLIEQGQQHHPALLRELASHVRGNAQASDDAVYQPTDAEPLLLRWEAASPHGKHARPLLHFLQEHPALGWLSPDAEADLSLGVRPSEYIQHQRRDFQLVPPTWDAIDWVLLCASNRNADDLADYYFLSPVSDEAPRWQRQRHATTLVIGWPDVTAQRPLSGSAWSQLALAHLQTKLHRRVEQAHLFNGPLLHLTEPTPIEANSAAPCVAKSEDFLELLAYWQTGAPDDWAKHWLGDPESDDTGASSLMLGLARAVIEPARRGRFNRGSSSSKAPLHLVSALETGTDWRFNTAGALEVQVTSWSVAPSLWRDDIAVSCSLQARLLAGEPIRRALQAANTNVIWRLEGERLGGLGSGEIAPQDIIKVPYQNFLGLLLILRIDHVSPLQSVRFGSERQ